MFKFHELLDAAQDELVEIVIRVSSTCGVPVACPVLTREFITTGEWQESS